MSDLRPPVSADTKSRIVATTVEVLRETDLHSLRVSDLARKANVSVPTLYYHFDSLGELVVEAVIVSLQRFLEPFSSSIEGMGEAVANDDKAAFLRSLQTFLDESWSVATAEEAHRLAPLMTHFRKVAPQDVRMRELQSAGVGMLAASIEQGQRKGWLSADINVATFVVLHWTCVLGQAVFWHPSFGPLTGLVEADDGWHLRFQTALQGALGNLPVR